MALPKTDQPHHALLVTAAHRRVPRADAQLATIWLRIGLIPRWLVGITLRDHAGLPDAVLAVRVLALLDGAYLAPRWVIDVDRDD